MNWRPHIHRDPQVLVGKPVIKGTRISVELVLTRLAAGWSIEDLLDSYPHLTREQIQACLAYAAETFDADRAPLTREAS